MATISKLRLRRIWFFCAALLLIPGTTAFAQDHSEHQGQAMETMSHGDHQMTPAMLAVLRERIPALRVSTDQQIALQMQMMGPNQSRYLSAESLRGDIGLLVLIHGFGETGDRIMTEAVQPMATIFPSAMGAGMAMMSAEHIQKSLDDLQNAGVKTVVVVPMAASKRNTLMYQWEYILGFRDHGGYYDVPRVQTDAKIIMAEPPAAHPQITRIILDHAVELSTDPDNEVVFVIAHGPIHDDENREQLAVMAEQAKRIRELGGFSQVEGVTLQDDAEPKVRDANVAKIREKIEAATADGKRVLIVTNLLAARSIQWKIERDFAGLDYEFSVKGVSMHPDFVNWFQENVSHTLTQL